MMAAETPRIVNAFRDMAWLNSARARAYAATMAIVWIGLLVKYILSLQDGYNSQGDPFGADYASFWAASRLVLSGWPADAYVRPMLQLAELPVLRQGYEFFFYPPTYLVLCTPLALLPFFPSVTIFLTLTALVFIRTIHRILGTRWAIPATLAFPAVFFNIGPGQNAFLTAAILGSGLTALDHRPRLAGAILGLMIIKPHLAVAVPIALVISRRWTTLVFAGATALGLVVLSCLYFGWEVWAAFLLNSHNARETLEQGLVGFAKMQSAFALARSLGADVVPAYAIQSIVAGASICVLVWARLQRVSVTIEVTLIVLASLLMTPFLLFYDMVILAVPLAWMLREWMEHGFPPWSKMTLLSAFLMPIGRLIYPPMPFGLLSLLLVGGCLLWYASTPLARTAPHATRAVPESKMA